jgi:putative molybdopterin biosynthesis protein
MIDLAALRRASQQDQFLDVVAPDVAQARFAAHLTLAPLGAEMVPLMAAQGRVLAQDIAAPVDVPGFHRASVDGFAVCAADLAGISEARPCVLRINQEILTPGVPPRIALARGTATPIATGGMVPRGADAVVMIEHTGLNAGAGEVEVAFTRPAAAGACVAAAGSDIARGETVLRAGCVIGAGEIGMLAAVGLGEISVWRKPRVAIFSTGDEIVAPGETMRAGLVYDSNAAILAASVIELGGEPVPLGIVPDDEAALAAMLARALALGDVVLLSGGTSKGAGDLAARVVSRLANPGVIVHGVAIKPGKPLCLAVSNGRPVAVLPGFPTSAIMSFHAFIAPVLRAFAGLAPDAADAVDATLAIRVSSERGRMEQLLVSLVHGAGGGLVAYPTGKGSGAVTSFTQADGFFAIPALVETVAAGTPVRVQRIGAARPPAELVIIGSHCVGLDYLVGVLEREGLGVKLLNVGSAGGLAAARRGECDIAPIHLMDPASGIYNTPFLPDGVTLVPGYGRMQGLVFRRGDARFTGSVASAMTAVLADPACVMMNRNAGSGTRVLIDQLLGDARPAGFSAAAKSHNAVAVAVAQGRADWGVAIETVASRYGLGFLPMQAERYDFAIPEPRRTRPAVARFIAMLDAPQTRAALAAMGFLATPKEA